MFINNTGNAGFVVDGVVAIAHLKYTTISIVATVLHANDYIHVNIIKQKVIWRQTVKTALRKGYVCVCVHVCVLNVTRAQDKSVHTISKHATSVICTIAMVCLQHQ